MNILAVCFIPLIAIFLIFVILINGLKLRYALWACILGLLAVLPIAFVQHFVMKLPLFTTVTVASLLLTAVLFNGVVEESVKLLFLVLLPQKRLPLAAFFACALLFGLALGSFESVIYLMRRIQNSALPTGASAAYKLVLVRMATAVLIHTFCAGLSGLCLWTGSAKKRRLLPFVYAALLHGVYNFFAGFTTGYRYFSIIAILFAALECRIWYSHLHPTNVPQA